MDSSFPSSLIRHQLSAKSTIQAVVIGSSRIYAGLGNGFISAWSLETYQSIEDVHAHEQSVLSLSLSSDGKFLFSASADSTVSVWSTKPLRRLCSYSSPFDVGDIFCVVYIQRKRVLLWGSQLGSIHWQNHDLYGVQQNQNHNTGPSLKSQAHKFFEPRSTRTESPCKVPGVSQHEFVGNEPPRDISPSNCCLFAHKSCINAMITQTETGDRLESEADLITADGEGTIKMWSINDLTSTGLQELGKIKNKAKAIKSLASKDFKLYAGMSDGAIYVYNLVTRQLMHRLQCDGAANQLQIIDDCLFCGTSEGYVSVFDNDFVKIECLRTAHDKILATASYKTQEETVICTAGDNGSIVFWNLKIGGEQSPGIAPYSDDRLVEALREFVAFRTVASNKLFAPDCHNATAFLWELCNSFGAKTSIFHPGEGLSPILFAEFQTSHPARSKNVLFYGHYDVPDALMDASNSSVGWDSDPFTLRAEDGYLYARGTANNKAAILTAIYAAGDLLQQGLLSCNVKFVIEGDGEAGSRGFADIVRARHQQIGPIDFILLSSGTWLDDNVPCVIFGTRGLVQACLTITSKKGELHSGMDGKNGQSEPLKDIITLLASLTGPSARSITLPDFYGPVRPMSVEDGQIYAATVATLLQYHPEIQSPQAFAQSLLERWQEPNLTVHHITVPNHQTASSIPASACATVSISIVPGQDAKKVAASLESYLKDRFSSIQSGNTLTVQIKTKANPWLGDLRSELFLALDEAVSRSWSSLNPNSPHLATSNAKVTAWHTISQSRPRVIRGSSLTYNIRSSTPLNKSGPLYIRTGGSLGVISFLEEHFGAEVAMLPIAQASDNPSLQNERIRLENLLTSRKIFFETFSRL